jgi:hypothetical protein
MPLYHKLACNQRIFIFQNSGVELQRGRKMFGEVGPVVAAGIGPQLGWNYLGQVIEKIDDPVDPKRRLNNDLRF